MRPRLIPVFAFLALIVAGFAALASAAKPTYRSPRMFSENGDFASSDYPDYSNPVTAIVLSD